MGWISFLATQVLFTSVTLGAMKRQGLIQVNTKAIQNDTLRYALVKAIDAGEDAVIFGENLVASLGSEIDKARKERK